MTTHEAMYVRLGREDTIKHLWPDMHDLVTACGILFRGYFPYVEGMDLCPDCAKKQGAPTT